jgi:hypothetical protein
VSNRDEVREMCRELLREELYLVLLTVSYLGYEIEKNEMDGEGSTYW